MEENNSTVLVSVVIITYNHAQYIRKAIDSVLEQSIYGHMEILVGDDASVDNTPLILNSYKQRAPDVFRIVQQQQNIGASKNIYGLFTVAKGKYIALLEGDDYWIDRLKLEKQVNFLEENHSFIGCTHECMILETNGKTYSNRKLEWVFRERHLTLEGSQGFFLAGQTGTLVFRNIFAQPEYDYRIIYQAHRLISDRTIQAILLAQGDLYRLDDAMSVYRYCADKHAGNVTSMMFVNDITGPYENLLLAEKIENYIRDTFRNKFDCRQIKIRFLSEAIIKLMRYPSSGSWKMIQEILHDHSHRRLLFSVQLPLMICRRLIYKIVRRREI